MGVACLEVGGALKREAAAATQRQYESLAVTPFGISLSLCGTKFHKKKGWEERERKREGDRKKERESED